MLTKELIGMIAEDAGLSKKDTEYLLSTMNAIIRENLMAEKAIQLQGLGVFEIKERQARVVVHLRVRANEPKCPARTNWFSGR